MDAELCSCGEWVAAEERHLCGDPEVVTVPPMNPHPMTGDEDVEKAKRRSRAAYEALIRAAQRLTEQAAALLKEAEEHR